MSGQPPLAYLGELRPAFVAHLADRLNNVIWGETQIYSDRMGIKAPLKSHSAILFLLRHGPASLSEIARLDGQSHQLLASRFDPLERMGFIERFTDPNDARRTPYRLTKAGREQARRIEAAITAKAEAMRRLFKEMDMDLIAVLEDALERLRVRPLGQRILEAQTEGKTGHVRKRKTA
ncbi:MAG TPA: MarR family transcriptional regulator [Rhizomicrobium sp.]|jgi:DNA-binding MarR family transcriptional regulator